MSTINWIEKKNGLFVDHTHCIGMAEMKYTEKQKWFVNFIEKKFIIRPIDRGLVWLHKSLIDPKFLYEIFEDIGLIDNDGEVFSNVVIKVLVPKRRRYVPVIITEIQGKRCSTPYLVACYGHNKQEQEDASRTKTVALEVD